MKTGKLSEKADIINKKISEFGLKNYLELGYHIGDNFDKIICENKLSVDVNGKADFNDGDLHFLGNNNSEFDCIFIDSLHECEHVRKVIIESLKCLSKNGIIVLHDVIPHSKEMQEVPRNSKQWTGDVWRAVVGFLNTYPDVKAETYRSDYGLTIIYPNGAKARKHFEDKEMSYDEFKKNEVELLNIID